MDGHKILAESNLNKRSYQSIFDKYLKIIQWTDLLPQDNWEKRSDIKGEVRETIVIGKANESQQLNLPDELQLVEIGLRTPIPRTEDSLQMKSAKNTRP